MQKTGEGEEALKPVKYSFKISAIFTGGVRIPGKMKDHSLLKENHQIGE